MNPNEINPFWFSIYSYTSFQTFKIELKKTDVKQK